MSVACGGVGILEGSFPSRGLFSADVGVAGIRQGGIDVAVPGIGGCGVTCLSPDARQFCDLGFEISLLPRLLFVSDASSPSNRFFDPLIEETVFVIVARCLRLVALRLFMQNDIRGSSVCAKTAHYLK